MELLIPYTIGKHRTYEEKRNSQINRLCPLNMSLRVADIAEGINCLRKIL